MPSLMNCGYSDMSRRDWCSGRSRRLTAAVLRGAPTHERRRATVPGRQHGAKQRRAKRAAHRLEEIERSGGGAEVGVVGRVLPGPQGHLDEQPEVADALAQPQDGPRERADHRLTAAQLMALVRTVTSQEVRASVAEAAGGSTAAERQALRDWIRQAAGRLAQGLKAAGR